MNVVARRQKTLELFGDRTKYLLHPFSSGSLKVRFTHFGFVLRSFNFPPSGWTKLKVRKTESEQTHHPGATVVHGYVK